MVSLDSSVPPKAAPNDGDRVYELDGIAGSICLCPCAKEHGSILVLAVLKNNRDSIEENEFNAIYLLPINLYGPRDYFHLETGHVIPGLIRKKYRKPGLSPVPTELSPGLMVVRDRKMLEQRLPELQIEEIRPMLPLRYLVSGGISMSRLVPASTYTGWRALEDAIPNWGEQPGMFALFCVSRP